MSAPTPGKRLFEIGCLAGATGWLALQCCLGLEAPPGPEVGRVLHRDRMEKAGLVVEFSVAAIAADARLAAGEDVRLRFEVRDTVGGRRLEGAKPAAWIDSHPDSGGETVAGKIERFISGGILGQAELDLNVYQVVVLNDDRSISIVDPRFNLGTTRLLNLLPLPGDAFDWVLSRDERRLFVSLPNAERIASIDTARWELDASLDPGRRATRLALQPDGHLLWSSDGAAGVTVIEAETGRTVCRMDVGMGPHEFAFSADSRTAFVANRGADGISVVDVRGLEVSRTLKTGRQPVSLTYSAFARVLYVSHQGSGEIVALDGSGTRIIARIPCGMDLGQIGFAPDGRFAVVLAPKSHRVLIVDAASNRVIQTGEVPGRPFQLAFSEAMAYIIHEDSAELSLIPLSQIGQPGQPLALATVPGGRHSPAASSHATPAARVVPASEPGAVLIANPLDKSVHLYKEGMSAPIGSFGNYSREARAVLVVDRSLKERAVPGVYETVGRLPRAGTNDVIFFLDAPRLIAHFQLVIGAQKNVAAVGDVRVAPIIPPEPPPRFQGEETRVAFSIREGDVALATVENVEVQIFQAPGIWRENVKAQHEGDGVFSAIFRPPRSGVYYANVTRIPGTARFAASQPAILNVLPR